MTTYYSVLIRTAESVEKFNVIAEKYAITEHNEFGTVVTFEPGGETIFRCSDVVGIIKNTD